MGLLLLWGVVSVAHAAPIFGNGGYVNAGYTASYTSGAMTLAASGANSILIVIVSSENSVSGLTVNYGGNPMTPLGSQVAYGNGATSYFNIFYITGQASGGTLAISGTGLSPFGYMWMTYAGVNAAGPIGATSINASNVINSSAGSLQTQSFSFTPQNAGSTVVEYLTIADGAGNLGTGYTVANGTVRQGPTGASNSHMTGGAFADFAPGSTSPFSLSESINPNYSSLGAALLGIELLPPVATNSPTITPTWTVTPTSTATPLNSSTPTVTPTFTATPLNSSPTVTPTSTATPLNSPTPTVTPQMALTKTSNVASATLGDTLTYCISYKNDSSGTVTMSVWDTVNSLLSYLGCNTGCSKSGSLVLWSIPGVASGASGTVCFWGTVNGYPSLPGTGERLALLGPLPWEAQP